MGFNRKPNHAQRLRRADLPIVQANKFELVIKGQEPRPCFPPNPLATTLVHVVLLRCICRLLAQSDLMKRLPVCPLSGRSGHAVAAADVSIGRE
jgi:hypothetical protein